jgi:hypothetical protein
VGGSRESTYSFLATKIQSVVAQNTLQVSIRRTGAAMTTSEHAASRRGSIQVERADLGSRRDDRHRLLRFREFDLEILAMA